MDLTRNQISAVCQKLHNSYPYSRLHNKRNPLSEAVFIILSCQTNESNYLATWHKFRARFPTMSSAEQAPVRHISHTIASGGLGYVKATQIKALLKAIRTRYGRLSLQSLRKLDDLQLERELCALPGMGVKSARCVMMYSFNRDVLPIDTHTFRVLKRLGLPIPVHPVRSKRFADDVQKQIPAGQRARLHINLVQHGRSICKARNPLCGKCTISQYCRFQRVISRVAPWRPILL